MSGGSHEDLVAREVSWAAESEGDDLGRSAVAESRRSSEDGGVHAGLRRTARRGPASSSDAASSASRA